MPASPNGLPETENLLGIVHDFALLLFESQLYHAGLTERKLIAGVFADALTQCYAIRRRLTVNPDRQVIAFVGMTNVGKSTLLNSILDSRGRNVTPRRNGPCTAAPVEFVYGDAITTTCIYPSQLYRPRTEHATIEELHERLSELVAESESTNSRPTKVTVTIPSRVLQITGVTIADTPGFGAASLGDASAVHESGLRHYLLNEATQVFWVVLAEQGIGRIEQDYYSTFFADICDDIIVTGSEDWSDEDKLRFQQRFERVIRSRTALTRRPGFVFVSGKQALKALQDRDQEKLDQSGIRIIARRIDKISKEPCSITNARDGLQQLSVDLAHWLTQYRTADGFPLKDWLRPDSYSRWRAKIGSCPIRNRLTADLKAPS